ncbi:MULTISPECIES: GNAT family N-acetyltransferase [Providencia]|uniref:GNAT family N-acetyltransferase n=3 Tax=Gammaproteobacteria TaxID=1236 RepID=A0AAJ1JCD5_PROST|nr:MULTISPECIES: GNAT family N-acetyltransferase [Providencia]SST02579.1 ribosomal-protein-alanine acetyltransferase [Acinetobacter baumannii]AIN62938.1 acetyltransferase family protein [Providencia stuartii]APG53077.1 GNAT family N-acetyltransferase [Providencia stuartii]AVE42887.1 GNAT family N-acetyltransferase [Providencia stuartii]AVL39387.1 GNAT family N-acetyltransferase [Providencia stuartii]
MGIQPATPAQYQQIMAVWESSVRATHDFLPENILQTLKVAIREQYLPQLATYVSIDENNQISGFIGVDQHKLEMLFISAAHRGKGIGKQLLNFAIKELGINEVDVNEQNPQAVGFYQHMGFTQFARSETDGEGNPFPILHMQLTTK